MRALLGQILALLRRPEIERLTRAAVAIGGDDGLAQARVAFFRARTAGTSDIALRAIERGELPATTDPEAVIEHLVAPAYLRLLLTGGPLDKSLLEESVSRTLAAFQEPRTNAPTG